MNTPINIADVITSTLSLSAIAPQYDYNVWSVTDSNVDEWTTDLDEAHAYAAKWRESSHCVIITRYPVTYDAAKNIVQTDTTVSGHRIFDKHLFT